MLLNYSEIARDSGVSVDTARRYLEYLRIPYQAALLQPFHQNLTSSVVKTPKVYWTNVGIWRQLTGFRGETTGQLYETMVVGEIIKWMRTTQCEGDLDFYRTRSGMELDLLLETPAWWSWRSNLDQRFPAGLPPHAAKHGHIDAAR